MAWLPVLLTIASTARLAILVTQDSFPPVVRFRSWVLEKATDRCPRTASGHLLAHPDEDAWYVLVTCPWCVSFWIGAPIAVAAWFEGGTPYFQIPALALAASLAAGIAARAR